MSKRIVPAALLALKQALTDVYWYKSDLRSFLTSTLRFKRRFDILTALTFVAVVAAVLVWRRETLAP